MNYFATPSNQFKAPKCFFRFRIHNLVPDSVHQEALAFLDTVLGAAIDDDLVVIDNASHPQGPCLDLDHHAILPI